MVKRKTNIKKILISLSMFLLTLTMLFATFAVSGIDKVHAEGETSYSNVLEDLGKDDTFNAADYPVIVNDASLSVISIAESVNQELFIYVYQPSGTYVASSINISTSVNEDLSYKNYDLELLNSSGVFFKYKVVNFQVSDDEIRYYDISSIFRPYNKFIDFEINVDNEVNEVAYKVGKCWCVGTVNGQAYYSLRDVETIEITDKFVGFIRYLNGYWLWQDACDAHFVAFSTDKPIDKLIQADVYYTAQIGSGSLATGSFHVDKTVESYVCLNADDVASNNQTGLFGATYTWNRIENASDFVADAENNPLTDDAKTEVENKEWVLRFVETDYSEYNGMYNPHYDATRISEVTILRLSFETNGEAFNLGVVDNKQTGSTDPVGETEANWPLFETIGMILKIIFWVVVTIVIIALIVIFWPIVSAILKGLWWLISWPFKKIKERSSK